MNNYEQDCLSLDKELATLLDWEWHEGSTKHRTGPTWDTWEWTGRCGAVDPVTSFCQIRWTQDDHSAFGLMVEYEIQTKVFKVWDEAVADGIVVNTQDFPTDKAALRYAIVQAVVNKLRSEER